jgi:hypothetical protein
MSIILDGTLGITSVNGAASLTAAGPAFSATNSAAQSVSATTNTKVTLNIKNFDTNSNFDATTNYRFTPTIAGYYQINAQATLTVNTNNVGIQISIYKNGSGYAQGVSQGDGAIYPTTTVSSVIYLNGSTDYIEMYVYISTSGNIAYGNQNTQFSGCLIRSA